MNSHSGHKSYNFLLYTKAKKVVDMFWPIVNHMSIKHIKSICWCSQEPYVIYWSSLSYIISSLHPWSTNSKTPTLFATYRTLLPVSSEWRGRQSVVLLGIISSIVRFKFGWQYTVVRRNLYNVLILSTLSWIRILAWIKTLAKSAGHVRLM